MNNITNSFYRASAWLKARSRIILQAGDNSVVDNRQLPNMPPGSKVVMSDDVYETLKMIGDISNMQRQEVPFLLFGHSEGQTVFFDRVEADKSASESGLEAVFSEYLTKKLSDFCKNANKKENKIFAHGHTHPRVGNSYLNYSLADIDAYINLRDNHEIIKNNVDLCGCLVTGGNYNFVFYDGNDTYRFDNVFVRTQNGTLRRLQAFGPDVNLMRYRHTRIGGQ